MIDWELRDGILTINGKEITIRGIPLRITEIDDGLIILTVPFSNPRNVLLLDRNGKVKWSIQETDVQEPIGYSNFFIEDDKLYAYNMHGFQMIVDIHNGTITKRFPNNSPW